MAFLVLTRAWTPADELSRALRFFSADEIAASRAYTTPLRNLGAAQTLLRIGLALALVVTSLGRWAADRALAWARGRAVLAAGLVVALLALGDATLDLPFVLARFSHRTAQHMTSQPIGDFLAQWLLGHALVAGIGALVTIALAATVRRFEKRAWLLAIAIVCALNLVGTLLFPIAIAPLFNRFTPIAQTPWAEREPRLRALAAAASVPADAPLYIVDASRQGVESNAYVAGLFGRGSARIVLYDNLLAKHTPAEVESTLGHELGHWRLGHVWLGLLLGCGSASVAIVLLWWLLGASRGRGPLALDTRYGPRAVVLTIALMVGGGDLAEMPILAASRAMETAADDAGLALTGDVCTAVDDERQYIRDAKADPVPHPVRALVGTHPQIIERIERACARVTSATPCCTRSNL